MKNYIWSLLLLIFSLSAWSARFSSTIHSIDIGRGKQIHLIKFDNGRVAFVENMDKSLVRILDRIRQKEQTVEVDLNRKNYLISIQSLPAEDIPEIDSIARQRLEGYRPTIFKNTTSALAMFKKMRRDYNKEGQCYSRAHVWSYEAYLNSKIQSMKMFIFFTTRYIRNYKFHWWFHVTPMVYVGKYPRTLDRRYASGPLQTKTWTDIFIKSKRTCPTVQNYNSYANFQSKQDCYLMTASMYYVIPRDLEKRDLYGVEKEGFIERELERAYRDGFL